MDYGTALRRLGISDQAKPTVAEVHSAWDACMEGVSDDATIRGLSQARAKAVELAEKWAVKENAMRERIEKMRVLSYDSTKPMDANDAMRELELDEGADEEEILATWEQKIRGTFPKEHHSEERKLNRARDMLLDRLQLPEFQEAVRARKAIRAEEMAQDILRKQLAHEILRKKAEETAQSAKTAQSETARSAEMARSAESADRRALKRAREDRQMQNETNEQLARERNNAQIEDSINNLLVDRLRTELPEARRHAALKKMARPGRPHVRTLDDSKKVRLLLEMERIFAECFREKQDGRVMARELFEVFQESTTESDVNKNDFKYHSRIMFLKIWPDATEKTYRHQRCFMGVERHL